MAFSIILLENLTELKTRRGNASSTTIASVLGLNYPPDEAFSFYRWDDTSTATGDDDEIVHPTVGSGLPGRWFKIDILITAQLIIAALGYTPYDASNPLGFISSYIESDPTVPSFAKSLVAFSVIKALTDPLYQPIGSYLTSETDPTVPAYSKSLTAFSVIQSSTDPLYRPITYVPSWTDITSKPTTIGGFGITDFNSLGDARWSLLGHTHTFASLTSKPTTVSGYGITDAYPLTGNPSGFLTSNQNITLSGDITGSGTTAITTTLSSVGTAGTYGIVTTDSKGRVTSGKRTETYSGVSNGSGNYTVVFGTAYSVAPNIQVCLINPNVRDTPIVTVTTTGFTVNIQRRTDTLGLLPSYANVVGGAVDVLITEK